MTHFYCNAFEKNATYQLKNKLLTTLEQNKVDAKDIVILCIGTDRATGDCLGPLVGEHLMQVLPHIPVYGNLENPIHALNLEETIFSIYQQYDNPFIIAIDASLGVSEHIGYATLSQKPLKPGKGVNKKLPAIGNLSITGIVNVAGFPNSILLQSTRLHTVMTLADCISNAIYLSFTEDRALENQSILYS
ncbi:MAG: spore protease YyaC [Lachnospiraceae bacterium]|nr:spore protease YyaC [Lachnospiraceae bacterium]